MKIPFGDGWLCYATHPKTPNKDPRNRGRSAHVSKDGKTTLCKMMFVEYYSADANDLKEENWLKRNGWNIIENLILPVKGICAVCEMKCQNKT